MPSTFNPPLNEPNNVQIPGQLGGVARGFFGSSSAGGLLRFVGDVTTRIDGDTSGVFSVTNLETQSLQRDPDLPPGSSRTWETVLLAKGPGPISMVGAGACVLTVGFTPPSNTQQKQFTATVVVLASGTTGPALLQFPIVGTVDLVGGIGVESGAFFGGGIAPGATEAISVNFTSTMQQDVTGILSYDASNPAAFSSPNTTVTIPAGGTAGVTVPVKCAAGSAPGRFDVFYRFTASNGVGDSGVQLSFQIVAGRTITVTTTLPTNLTLQPGSSTPCTLTAFDTGGVNGFNLVPAPLPAGITLNMSPPTKTFTGPSIEDSSVTTIQMVIGVGPNAPLGKLPAPLLFNWDVPLDATHAAQSGSVAFNIEVGVVSPIAVAKIKDFHRRTGADYGRLGIPIGAVTLGTDGTFQQDYQLGNIHLDDIDSDPTSITEYTVQVTLSACRCFGTQDSDGSDSTYLVITLFSVDPNFGGADVPVKTTMTAIQDNVHAGQTLFKMQTLDDVPIPVGSGLNIHVAVWDHESGNVNDIRDKIQAVIQDGVNKGAAALAGGAAADDPTVSSGTVGQITGFSIGGVKPFEILTLGIASVIANAFADDLVGEQCFNIPAENIASLADAATLRASVRTDPDLPNDVQLNWPPTFDDEKNFLFTDGHGTYKVYFLLNVAKTVFTLIPGVT
jgi:hypothetical protein